MPTANARCLTHLTTTVMSRGRGRRIWRKEQAFVSLLLIDAYLLIHCADALGNICLVFLGGLVPALRRRLAQLVNLCLSSPLVLSQT